MLRQAPFPEYIWRERKTMANLEELYSPKGEGTSLAIHLANNANNYGLDVAERLRYIYTQPDLEAYTKILEALRPENALIFLIAKGVETDRTEKWYGTEYSITEAKGKLYQTLKQAQPRPELHLPGPNIFVPKNTKVLPDQPVLISQTPYITLWYFQDREFSRPKVALYLHILSNQAYADVRSAVLTELYTILVQEQLNEYSYPALLAGLAYTLSATDQGVFLNIKGYSDAAFKLLDVIGNQLRNLKVTEETFASIKERYMRGFKNFPYGAPYSIARQVSRQINLKKYFSPEQKLESVAKITLEDVKQFVHVLYAQHHIEAWGVVI